MKQLFVVFFIALGFNIFSQQEAYKQNIRGTVIDDDTETPLPGASVILLGTDPIVGTTSDIDGKFVIENIKTGRLSLEISFIGYATITLNNLMLTSGKELVLNIKLKEQVFVTEQVVIKANSRKDKPINEMATVSARSFSVEETERYAGSLGDPSRMVANYAGVMSVSDSRNDIIIRGNTPTGLLWRLDGIEIPNPNHFGSLGSTGGPISMLNNNLLSNSDFFTSAWPAQYGNAISGVFDLKLRSGNDQKHEFTGQIGFNGFELGAEGPIKKGQSSYMISYRYSTLSVFNMIGFNIGVGQAIPQYQDLTFKVDVRTKKAGRFTVFGIGGKSFIKLYDSEKSEEDGDAAYSLGGYDTDFGSDMGVVGLSHVYFFNEKTQLRSTISVYGTHISTMVDSLQFDTNQIVIPNSNAAYYRGDMKENRFSVSVSLKRKINKKNIFRIGTNIKHFNINYVDSATVHRKFVTLTDIDGSMNLLKSYAEFKHRFSNKITLNTGLYSQFLYINKSTSIEPRIGLKYNFTSTQSINLGYGLHSQTQVRTAYFYQTRLADGTYIKTNENLDFTYSSQFVLAYDYLFTENTRLKVETYYQNLFNIPVKESFAEFSLINSGDDFYIWMEDSLINNGTGTNYGLEITFEHFLYKGFYFLITSSLFESKYKGADGIERNTAWNGNYVFNGLFGYEMKATTHGIIGFNIKSTYAGGKRYVPIDLEESRKQYKTVYNYEEAYEHKYNDYFCIDLRISFKLNGKKINQEWALDLQNVTNNKNIFRQVYNKQTGGLTTDYQTSFFPMFMYRINF